MKYEVIRREYEVLVKISSLVENQDGGRWGMSLRIVQCWIQDKTSSSSG
jgi:hypothetical protein